VSSNPSLCCRVELRYFTKSKTYSPETDLACRLIKIAAIWFSNSGARRSCNIDFAVLSPLTSGLISVIDTGRSATV